MVTIVATSSFSLSVNGNAQIPQKIEEPFRIRFRTLTAPDEAFCSRVHSLVRPTNGQTGSSNVFGYLNSMMDCPFFDCLCLSAQKFILWG